MEDLLDRDIIGGVYCGSIVIHSLYEPDIPVTRCTVGTAGGCGCMYLSGDFSLQDSTRDTNPTVRIAGIPIS
jgi:hypothetical protein